MKKVTFFVFLGFIVLPQLSLDACCFARDKKAKKSDSQQVPRDPRASLGVIPTIEVGPQIDNDPIFRIKELEETAEHVSFVIRTLVDLYLNNDAQKIALLKTIEIGSRATTLDIAAGATGQTEDVEFNTHALLQFAQQLFKQNSQQDEYRENKLSDLPRILTSIPRVGLKKKHLGLVEELSSVLSRLAPATGALKVYCENVKRVIDSRGNLIADLAGMEVDLIELRPFLRQPEPLIFG